MGCFPQKCKQMTNEKNEDRDLAGLLNGFLLTNDERRIIEYLLSNSGLPGPRGNLELAKDFVGLVEDYVSKSSRRMWSLCVKLADVSPDEAPVNNPREFLPFCGIYAMGAIGSSSLTYFREALSRIRKSASDPRWRIREAVAMGIQELLAKQTQNTLKELEGWIMKDNWLVMRAVAAGVAEPALLTNKRTARSALKLHKRIFTQILNARERGSGEFKTLKKGLGYTLSVVICAVPKEGFEYMHELLDSRDADVVWIIKENLKKNRLMKNYPDNVASVEELLRRASSRSAKVRNYRRNFEATTTTK